MCTPTVLGGEGGREVEEGTFRTWISNHICHFAYICLHHEVHLDYTPVHLLKSVRKCGLCMRWCLAVFLHAAFRPKKIKGLFHVPRVYLIFIARF